MLFTGKHYYLDNKYPTEINVYIGNQELGLKKADISGEVYTFPSLINAFCTLKMQFSNLSDKQKIEMLLRLQDESPYVAEKLVDSLVIEKDKQLLWENSREALMAFLITCKFTQNKDLAQKLINEPTIIYDNADPFWGYANGKGLNTLGCLLEKEKYYRNTFEQQISVYTTSYLKNDKCIVYRRTILEKGTKVYNYTERITEGVRGKEVFITRWDKKMEQDYEMVSFDTNEDNFAKHLTCEIAERDFIENEMENDYPCLDNY